MGTVGRGLVNGERMSQAEFHRRYEECRDDVKIELIGGTVFVASPLRYPHGTYHSKLAYVLEHYCGKTPGVETGIDATTILGKSSEPRPDLFLRIDHASGGQSHVDEDQYLTGPPELLAEIAHSSRAIDLHQKRDDYELAGVQEYLVVCVEEEEIVWHNFAKNKMIRPSKDGLLRSAVFPGLWIDEKALLARDRNKLLQALEQGAASPEHAKFAKRLEKNRQRHAK